MITRQQNSLWRLLIAQTQVVFNDNAAKLVLIGIAPLIFSKAQADDVTNLLAVLLVLPFALFSPFCGWIADRFAKKIVLRRALYLQFVLILLLTAALHFHKIGPAIALFFFLACQACLFSPAKQGALKEIVGSAGLGRAVGLMEALTICGILLGGLGGGWLFNTLDKHFGNPWTGATAAFALLSCGCLLSILVFRSTETGGSKTTDPFRPSLLWSHFHDLLSLWSNRGLFLAAMGVAYFYALGGALYLILIETGRTLYPGQSHAALCSGWFLALLGIGVVAGSVTAIYFAKHRHEMGLVPVGGLGLSAGLLFLASVPAGGSAYKCGLLALGVCSGLFIVPLNTYLQDNSPEDRRGRVLAAANLLINLGGIAAVIYYAILEKQLHFSGKLQLLALVPSSLIVALCLIFLVPESLLRFLHGFYGRLIYDVRSVGADNIPQGAALLVSNHVSYVDAVVMQLACPRPIRFMAFDEFFKAPLLGTVLRIAGAIPVSQRRAKDAVQAAVEKLKQGELVCIFPEGELTRTGKIMGFKKGFELIARRAGVAVVPVHLDSLWGSIFSFTKGRYFFKIPERIPYPATVSFGQPESAAGATAACIRQRILDLGEQAFRLRPGLHQTLAFSAIRALKQKPWTTFLIDHGLGGRRYSRALVLGLSLGLVQQLRIMPGRRIGIALPPGLGAVLANLGCVFAGKIPVNLNFMTDRGSAQATLKTAGIQTVLSAERLRLQFRNYPWPEYTLDMDAVLKKCSITQVVLHVLAGLVLPEGMLCRWFTSGRPNLGDEAVLLFTSGSSGNPKGVPLSHGNILGNVSQVDSVNIIRQKDTLLGCLPFFHSFGLVMTFWLPLLKGLRLVTVPSPLDLRGVGEAVEQEKVSVLIGTPSFLQGYARKLEPAQLRSVRIAVTGAEKLPAELVETYRQKFSVLVYEGYGLTEASPVVSFNIPDPLTGAGATSTQAGQRAGSVGRLLPGIAVRLLNPADGSELPLDHTGVLALKGINIFKGYLDQPVKTAEMFRDGWLVTGDLVHFDADGFLFIEGRLSRFSKIGGEMVPHAVVEQKINSLLGLNTANGPYLVVVGIPDPAKGEALVLLTTNPVDQDRLRILFNEAGVPNLWLPRQIQQVDSIPLLGSGKLDLAGCVALAEKNPA